MALSKLTLRPEQATYAVGAPTGIVTTELDGGFSRSRRDIISSASIIDCTWFLNLDQFQYMKAFFNTRTNRGIDPFLIDLLLDQPYLVEYEAKFVPDSFKMVDPLGLSRKITAQLEVIPIDDPELDDVTIIFYEDNMFNSLEQLANFDLNVDP